jgi:hypothetical protein
MLALKFAPTEERGVGADLDGFVTRGEFVGIDTRDSTDEFPN